MAMLCSVHCTRSKRAIQQQGFRGHRPYPTCERGVPSRAQKQVRACYEAICLMLSVEEPSLYFRMY